MPNSITSQSSRTSRADMSEAAIAAYQRKLASGEHLTSLPGFPSVGIARKHAHSSAVLASKSDLGPPERWQPEGTNSAAAAASTLANKKNLGPKLWEPEASADASAAASLSKARAEEQPRKLSESASAAALQASHTTGEEYGAKYLKDGYAWSNKTKGNAKTGDWAHLAAGRSLTLTRDDEKLAAAGGAAALKEERDGKLPTQQLAMDISKIEGRARENARKTLSNAHIDLTPKTSKNVSGRAPTMTDYVGDQEYFQRQDVLSLVTIADRNVRAQLAKVNKDVADRNVLGNTEHLKAAYKLAAERSKARTANFGKVDMGGGLFMTHQEVDEIARKNVQPTLDEVTEVAKKKRQADKEQAEKEAAERKKREELRIKEKAEKDAKAQAEKERKDAEKIAFREKREREKAAEAKRKAEEKAKRDEQKAIQRAEQDKKRAEEQKRKLEEKQAEEKRKAEAKAAESKAAESKVESGDNTEASEGGLFTRVKSFLHHDSSTSPKDDASLTPLEQAKQRALDTKKERVELEKELEGKDKTPEDEKKLADVISRHRHAKQEYFIEKDKAEKALEQAEKEAKEKEAKEKAAKEQAKRDSEKAKAEKSQLEGVKETPEPEHTEEASSSAAAAVPVATGTRSANQTSEPETHTHTKSVGDSKPSDVEGIVPIAPIGSETGLKETESAKPETKSVGDSKPSDVEGIVPIAPIGSETGLKATEKVQPETRSVGDSKPSDVEGIVPIAPITSDLQEPSTAGSKEPIAGVASTSQTVHKDTIPLGLDEVIKTEQIKGEHLASAQDTPIDLGVNKQIIGDKLDLSGGKTTQQPLEKESTAAVPVVAVAAVSGEPAEKQLEQKESQPQENSLSELQKNGPQHGVTIKHDLHTEGPTAGVTLKESAKDDKFANFDSSNVKEGIFTEQL